MIFLFAPTKKMVCDDGWFGELTEPVFLDEAKEMRQLLQNKTQTELKALYKCSDKVAAQAYEDLHSSFPESPAILSYSGIAFRTMAPHLFSDEMEDYARRHLRILSAVYGFLRPYDGVVPYRLEMQTKMPWSLYEFWADKVKSRIADDEVVVNLASEEYAKVLRKKMKLIDVRFCEQEDGKLKEKGVYVKIARGAMFRWLAENNIEDIEHIKEFDELDYKYDEDASSDDVLVFAREKVKK